MKRKNFILAVVLLLFFASWALAEEGEDEAESGVIFNGEVWSSMNYYTAGDAEVEVNVFASIEGDVNSEWTWYSSVQAVAGSLSGNGADIFARDGEVSAVSLKEAYVSSESWRIGKQTFPDEASVKFDFASLNLFETRDLSRPFSVLDADRRLGNWGVARALFDGRLKVVALLAEPPIIATDEDDPWARQLPQGLHYGDMETEVDYSVGVRWGDNVGDMKYDIYLQHGSGNSPVDVNVNSAGEVRPIIAKQTALSVSFQNPLGEWNMRLGAAGYFQSEHGDFVVGVAELERFWENLIQSGDVFFFDVGFADAWETESGNGVPELDLRRIYDGGTVLMAMEYSFDDWILKLKGAYNFDQEGMYISPEVVWMMNDSVEMSLKYEMIDGHSSRPDPLDNIWSTHSDDDRIVLGIRWYF